MADAKQATAIQRDDVAVAGDVNRMIQAEVKRIYDSLEPLRRSTKFPSFAPVSVPMVLVLGNHSSGKSTFINYMLQQPIQKTGRAPTDCTFTIMVGGEREERLDGATLVRHAQYGFEDVAGLFGREFVSQIELKVLKGSPLLDHSGMMLVDSPGMIDPPGMVTGNSTDRRSLHRQHDDSDRGYDFKRAVEWFAERADVILVMFDPDKPGTTFETLDVLTTLLHNVASKVLLILNKVDDFATVHDFARAYGALCWNLSKVIPRKDLPLIYTMYVPQNARESPALTLESTQSKSEDNAERSSQNHNREQTLTVPQMLEREFDGTRGEILREVERSPDRATDNILNLLKATTSRLKMHMTLIEACRKEYFDLELLWQRIQYASIAAGVGITLMYVLRSIGQTSSPAIEAASPTGRSEVSATATAATTIGVDTPEWKQNWARKVAKTRPRFQFAVFFKLIVSSCVGNAMVWKSALVVLERKRDQVLEWLPRTFERVYAPWLCRSDRISAETRATWQAVEPSLAVALASKPINEFPVFPAIEKAYLDDVLQTHLPRLDRCVRDRTGDDHAFLRLHHLQNSVVGPAPQQP